MARIKRVEIEDLSELGIEALNTIADLLERYKNTPDVFEELKALQVYANILAEKPLKIARLRDFIGYKFAVIENGEPRNASKDEALRLIMGYQQGNAIDVIRDWVVIDGQWVKRPHHNPDGTTVKNYRDEG